MSLRLWLKNEMYCRVLSTGPRFLYFCSSLNNKSETALKLASSTNWVSEYVRADSAPTLLPLFIGDFKTSGKIFEITSDTVTGYSWSTFSYLSGNLF